jgi:BirA family biotin operon repressor/biotin-[acetyl-CoA-carboxylase] ligase
MAAELGISRASVWKAVKTLRQDGYPIEAATNRGYSLSSESGLLSVQGIFPHLKRAGAGGGTACENIHIFESLESTNLTAKKMALDGAPPGTVVIAGRQTRGKGRFGRAFYSPTSDSLYISFILAPAENVKTTQLITVAASVAVCRAIEAVAQVSCEIKWVNDIFADGKKICGILTEAVTDMESGQIESAVLGIGININMAEKDFPEPIRDTAGSVSIPKGMRNRFVAELINNVLSARARLEDKAFIPEYRRRSIVVGRKISVLSGGAAREATAEGVSDDGSLVVRYPDGSRETLHSGEISVRLDSRP